MEALINQSADQPLMSNTGTVITEKHSRTFAAQKTEISGSSPCRYIEKNLMLLLMKINIFFLAYITLRRPSLIWRTFNTAIIRLRNNFWGGSVPKLFRVDGKYYFNMYSPGWPSKAYNNIWKSELRRHVPANINGEKPFFAFLAITRKCPMKCEHCFEWGNLNQKESFTKDELLKVIDMYQHEGVQQFHFSGGEPMTRLKDLLELLRFSKGKSQCWVVTSGFNCTEENAMLLKEAGCKGVVVSIDHHLPEMHNIFRGHRDAFEHATNAVRAVKKAGMVCAICVCATRLFIDSGHLLPYFEFAKKLGVHFVQLLEPKGVGHYEGKDVMLKENHIQILEGFFKLVNHSKKYKGYPTLLYHGYHQRRVGCLAANRSVYIDSAGDVHSCPFCHTSSYNIIDVIRRGENIIPKKENVCPQFKKIA